MARLSYYPEGLNDPHMRIIRGATVEGTAALAGGVRGGARRSDHSYHRHRAGERRFTAFRVRLIPVYRRLSFTPGFWSFSFAYAAAVSDALVWLAITKPSAATGYAIAVITLLTAFVSWIAFRTVLLAVRGQPLAERPGAPTGSAHRPGLSWPAASGLARRSR